MENEKYQFEDFLAEVNQEQNSCFHFKANAKSLPVITELIELEKMSR